MADDELAPLLALLNAQEEWTTDDSMLGVIPSWAREFQSGPEWPKLKALTYLNNNTTTLRQNLDALEAGGRIDCDQINPVVATVRLQIAEADAASKRPGLVVGPALVSEKMNLGTAYVRFAVQRAFYGFIRYAERRRADPAYPGDSPGAVRIRPCGAPECRLLAATTGEAAPICARCASAKERVR